MPKVLCNIWCSDSRRIKQLRNESIILTGMGWKAIAVVLTAVVLASAYSSNHPGRITISIPSTSINSTTDIAVSGTVQNNYIDQVVVFHDGRSHRVRVVNGRFNTKVQAKSAQISIQAASYGAPGSIGVRSNIIVTGRDELCTDGVSDDLDGMIAESCLQDPHGTRLLGVFADDVNDLSKSTMTVYRQNEMIILVEVEANGKWLVFSGEFNEFGSMLSITESEDKAAVTQRRFIKKIDEDKMTVDFVLADWLTVTVVNDRVKF